MHVKKCMTRMMNMIMGTMSDTHMTNMSRTVRHKLTGAKSISSHCRNHGICHWCRSNRRYNELRDLIKTEQELKEVEEHQDTLTVNRNGFHRRKYNT